MPDVFDPSTYLRLPRLDVRGALSLGKLLLQQVPRPAPAAVKRKAVALREAVQALETAFGSRVTQTRAADLRPFDRRLARLWNAIRERLGAYQALFEHDEQKTQAAELHAVLFGDGLGFLQLPDRSRYAESDKRLVLIDETDNTPVLERLVDPIFVEELRAAHEGYGEVLGVTRMSGAPEDSSRVLEPLQAMYQAISIYTVHVLAFGTEEPRNEALARQALEPFDRVRRTVGAEAGMELEAGLSTVTGAESPLEQASNEDPNPEGSS